MRVGVTNKLATVFTLLAFHASAVLVAADESVYLFTDRDIGYLQQFSIDSLPPLPPAVGNRYADNQSVARLGHRLFFDNNLSANREIACATCHQPKRYFTDGLPQAQGLQKVTRNTPSLLGAAYGPWLYWDGRKDSLWAQALEPLEDPREQGLTRDTVAEYILQHYSDAYQNLFGAVQPPLTNSQIDAIFVNAGKALMAYQRRLQLPPAPIDDFIDALAKGKSEQALRRILTENQVQGLRLFVGKAGCVSCHNGPLFSNFEFHNVGIPERDTNAVDLGRFTGIEKLRGDEFTCLSKMSDASPDKCLEMQYLKQQGPELVGAFKTPSLRNVAKTAPYMHSGQFKTLAEVINHYNKPTPPQFIRDQHPSRPHFDILPLNLTELEIHQLIVFLHALTSPLPNDDSWWSAP